MQQKLHGAEARMMYLSSRDHIAGDALDDAFVVVLADCACSDGTVSAKTVRGLRYHLP